MKKFMSVMLSAMMMVMLFVTPVLAFKLGTDVEPTPIDGAGGIVAKIVGTMQWIGYAIAIGMLVYIGIKYVMASANEKADLKNSLIKYVIGAALIIFAVTIANAIFSINAA